MRKVFLLALLVAACAKKEPAPDTTTPAPPPPPPPPPALTAADIAGTWNGTSKRDTTTTTFTVKSTSDTTATVTFAKTKVTVAMSTKVDADSVISTSKPYKDPTLPKGTPNVTFRAVGRMKDGKLVGTTTLMLASKPDSVVGKANWEATKAP